MQLQHTRHDWTAVGSFADLVVVPPPQVLNEGSEE